MSAVCTHAPIPLVRAWPLRTWDALIGLWQAAAARRAQTVDTMDLQSAIELNDATLRDIGVCDELRESVSAWRDGERMRLTSLRADLGGGGLSWRG